MPFPPAPGSPRLLAFLLVALSLSGHARSEVQLARTVLPDALPSSFAVGLPGGLSFCYDPTRGGLSYAWKGGFADLSSVRPNVGKFVYPIKLLGERFYRESGDFPLRRGDPKRVPSVHFKGYRLEDAAIEFHYTVDGVQVHERIQARPDGTGLVRRFRFDEGGADARWWYLPGTAEGNISSPTGRQEGGGLLFEPGSSREFTLEITPSRP